MAELTELAKQVIRVLIEDSVKKINFHLGGLEVSGEGLQQVAEEIRKGNIKVQQDDKISQPAEYDPDNDTIKIKGNPDFTRTDLKGLIVHEAVHALTDMVKATQTRQLAGEAAAFLAQSIYLWHEKGDLGFESGVSGLEKSSDPKEKQDGAIFRACINLISRYKLSSKSVWLPPELYKNLLMAIKAHDAYKNIRWDELLTANGIKTASAEKPKDGVLSRGYAQRSSKTGTFGTSKKPGPIGIG